MEKRNGRSKQIAPAQGERFEAGDDLALLLGNTGVFRVAYDVLLNPFPFKYVPVMPLISAIFTSCRWPEQGPIDRYGVRRISIRYRRRTRMIDGG